MEAPQKTTPAGITPKKVYYKYEVAKMIGVSSSVFCVWINKLYINHLLPTGYKKNQKYLTWPQIKILDSILDFLE